MVLFIIILHPITMITFLVPNKSYPYKKNNDKNKIFY